MKIDSAKIDNFRNIEHAELEFSTGVNILCGMNGQGKTNLLEALWLLTGSKSFRGAKNSEMIRFDAPKATINALFSTSERQQRIELTVTPEERSAVLNDVKLSAPGQLMGNLCAVVFSPEHIKLVIGTAQERRLFLDGAICQAKPAFARTLVEYRRVLAQRNALIKNLKNNSFGGADMLAMWNAQLGRFGAEIAYTRRRYVSLLSAEAQKLYEGISGGREKLTAVYYCSFAKGEPDKKELEEILTEKLRDSTESDIQAGFTYYGCHRDDLDVRLDEKSARQFASQGQKRSCVLALKLAQAALSENYTGEMPVAILDDVLSELDEERQSFLLSKMDGWQVIITCCEEASVSRLVGGKVFRVSEGTVEG